MRRFFQHIRNQPKEVRNNYAFGFASTFTGIVALIWVVTKAGSGIAVPEVAIENNPGSFSTLIKQTKEQAANAQAALKQQFTNSDADSADNKIDIESVIASSTESVYREATTTNEVEAATTTPDTSTEPVAVPVLIATTSATTSMKTSTSTP